MHKIKLLKASSVYPGYKAYIQKKGIILSGDFETQLNTLLRHRFGWSDFWKRSLPGDIFDVEEIIINVESLQKQWAQEHQISYGEHSWTLEIFEHQIAYLKPDVIFITDFGNVTREFRMRIKEKYPFVKLLIGWDGVAHNDPELFGGYDMVLSCFESIATFYKEHGFDSYYFPYGFLGGLLKEISLPDKPTYDVTFAGSVFSGVGFHNQRLSTLSALARHMRLDIWTDSFKRMDFVSKAQMRRLYKRQFNQFLDVFYLSRHRHEPVFGIDMFQVLADSKITLNHHIDSTGDKAGNLRLFEATGVGACLVTDYKDNLKDFFELDREVVTYRTKEEALDKITYLMNHEDERKKIAAAGQARTLKDHKIEDRIKSFGDFLLTKI